MIALLVAGVPTVLALVASRIQQEFVAERAQDDLVELPLDEFVAVHLVDFVLALTDCTLTAETSRGIQRPLTDVLLDYGHGEHVS